MSRMMERLGCKVDMAENGQIALEMLLATSQADRDLCPPGIDPRSGDATKNYDITFLDNQVRVCVNFGAGGWLMPRVPCRCQFSRARKRSVACEHWRATM